MFGSIIGSIAGIGANLLGQHQSTSHADYWNNKNIQLQKEFAQNSIKWRVEDAKRAGVHPMAALGINASSFSPVSTSIPSSPDYGSFLSDLGQNVDRAIMVGKDRDARKKAEDISFQQSILQTEKLGLENDLLRAQIDSLKSTRNTAKTPAAPPANPQLVQDSGGVDKVHDEVIVSPPDNPSVTAGTHPLWTHARSGSFVLPVLSDKVADAVTENKEKNVGAEIAYALDAWNGAIRPPANAFSERERQLMASGEYEAYYYPFLGWRVEPKLTWSNFKKFVLGGYRGS